MRRTGGWSAGQPAGKGNPGGNRAEAEQGEQPFSGSSTLSDDAPDDEYQIEQRWKRVEGYAERSRNTAPAKWEDTGHHQSGSRRQPNRNIVEQVFERRSPNNMAATPPWASVAHMGMPRRG